MDDGQAPSLVLARPDSRGRRLCGRRVGVVGLGKSGVAAVELLLRHGAKVIATDDRSVAELGELATSFERRGVRVRAGGIAAVLDEAVDAWVVSPGVPLSTPALAALRQVPVFGEVELAFVLMPQWRGPVLGVTGTNGKSTTTALTGVLVAQAGGRVFVGGNLGRPWSEAALDTDGFDAHVIELSSFQLEGVQSARFNGAAVLNLTPDHLDRYASQREYGAAKARIFARQKPGDFAVVNASDSAVMELAKDVTVPVYGFGPAAHAVPEEQGFRFAFGAGERFGLKNRALRGEHNRDNAMAAALLARLSGVSAEQIQRGLDSFPGLAHRLEWVRTFEGVEWINDSKATNVDSALVALRALSGRVWLIAGGKGKGASYEPWVEEARGKVRGVLTIGADADRIAQAFSEVVEVHPCGTLREAVVRARALAQGGDTVLLSPACASYDQFKNFEERGEAFRALVQEL